MQKKIILLGLVTIYLIMSVIKIAVAGNYPIDLAKASSYFEEIKELVSKDNGNLWGRDFWGPILLIDPQTRFTVATHADHDGLLEKAGDVYIGYFPQGMGIANSITRFGSKDWVMLMYPLREPSYAANVLAIHELFHLWQMREGLQLGHYNNDHMDQMDARILLKLEWLALEKAMTASAKKRKELLVDALIFRNYRRELYPDKTIMENRMEVHEGLAEYTGHRICSEGDEDFAHQVLLSRDKFWDAETYVRSFGYYTGMLYAFMLDLGKADWHANVHPDSDMGLMAQVHYEIRLPEDFMKAWMKVKERYGYVEILEYETRREQKRQETLEAYRQKFIRDTVLVLEVPQPRIVFNPNNLVPLDDLGTVYPTLSIMADWGTLQVHEGGCLFDWQRAVVSALGINHKDNIITGDGWELELTENWRLVRDGRKYRLLQSE